MSDNEWLQTLSVGDEVVLDESRYGSFDASIVKVARLTQHRVYIEATHPGNGAKWDRWFHRAHGDGPRGDRGAWGNTASIREATTELRARIDAHRRTAIASATLNGWQRAKLTIDQLERIAAIINEGRAET